MKLLIPSLCFGAVIALANLATTAFAQGLPKAQPKILTIIREEVKYGHVAEHAKHEAGWPAALEKAKSPDYYIALTSMTGPDEAWFLLPAESHKAIGESMKRDAKDPVLSAEMARLALADSAHVNTVRTIQAVARPELGVGSFPDPGKARFFEITTFRIRPGQEEKFEQAARAYAAAKKRATPDASYRVYQVLAGMSGPAFMAITTLQDYGEFDRLLAESPATFKAATPEETANMQKYNEAVLGEENNRFRVDPVMSYVPKETRAQDPEFWSPAK